MMKWKLWFKFSFSASQISHFYDFSCWTWAWELNRSVVSTSEMRNEYVLNIIEHNLKQLNSLWQIIFTGLRKVYPYYFTFTTFTKGRWVGEKILDVFAREFRAHPVEEYVSVSSSYSGWLLPVDHPGRFFLIKMERVNESNCGWHGLLLSLTLG